MSLEHSKAIDTRYRNAMDLSLHRPQSLQPYPLHSARSPESHVNRFHHLSVSISTQAIELRIRFSKRQTMRTKPGPRHEVLSVGISISQSTTRPRTLRFLPLAPFASFPSLNYTSLTSCTPIFSTNTPRTASTNTAQDP